MSIATALPFNSRSPLAGNAVMVIESMPSTGKPLAEKSVALKTYDVSSLVVTLPLLESAKNTEMLDVLLSCPPSPSLIVRSITRVPNAVLVDEYVSWCSTLSILASVASLLKLTVNPLLLTPDSVPISVPLTLTTDPFA